MTERIKQPPKLEDKKEESIQSIIIHNFPFIFSLTFCSPDATSDGAKNVMDAKINPCIFKEYFGTDLVIPDKKIRIQIEPSGWKVPEAKIKIRRENGLARDQITNWLNENKLIIVSEGKHLDYFLTNDISEMNKYWKEHNKNKSQEVKTP